MARLFVSNSPARLSDQELMEHATELSKHLAGYKLVAILTALMMVGVGYYFEAVDNFLFPCGIALGFYSAQSRLAVLAERIKRLEKQQQG